MSIPQTTLHFRAAFKYCFRNSDFESQKAVAQAAKVSQSTVSEILTKKSYGPGTQAKIAAAFGYDDLLDFLALGRRLLENEDARSVPIQTPCAQETGSPEEHTEYYRKIPLYESGKLAAGEKGMVFDPYEQPSSMIIVYQQELTGRKYHHLIGLRVGGSSMSPLIPPRSVVIIDLDDRELVNNKIYAVNYPTNGENIAAVKRVQKWKKGFALLSANLEYPPELSELDWRDLCVGRAIWIWQSLENL